MGRFTVFGRRKKSKKVKCDNGVDINGEYGSMQIRACTALLLLRHPLLSLKNHAESSTHALRHVLQ
jgi:hypothetical protein